MPTRCITTGELPPALKYGNTHGVCTDSQGNIYINHAGHATSQSPDAMAVFDEKEISGVGNTGLSILTSFPRRA
jgi:hypothetical protein